MFRIYRELLEAAQHYADVDYLEKRSGCGVGKVENNSAFSATKSVFLTGSMGRELPEQSDPSPTSACGESRYSATPLSASPPADNLLLNGGDAARWSWK